MEIDQNDLEKDSVKLDCEEGSTKPEPEIDVRTDPFQSYHLKKPKEGWEDMIRGVKPKKPKPPKPEEQRKQVREILGIIEAKTAEPLEGQVEEALSWISNMQSINPDHEDFVASNF
jgi:hypothetical protein